MPPPASLLSSLLELKNQNTNDFTASSISKTSLSSGVFFAPINSFELVAEAGYDTVQTGLDSHIKITNDLLYINHSCAPSLEFDVAKMEVRVSRERDLKIGDSLTFFYPSTEWKMAQSFDCWCGAAEGVCLGRVDGAEKIAEGVLRRWWLNNHIVDMLRERRRGEEDGEEGG